LKSVLIDSDILIEVSRAKDTAILAKWDDLSRGNTALLCSPVTVAELWHGARQTERKILDALFAAIQCVPIDLEIGRQAGEYLRQFSKSHSVELGDALIAVAAAVHDLELWTRNRRHYPMKDISFYLA
jgi:predicted nucleic acid-binding protein